MSVGVSQSNIAYTALNWTKKITTVSLVCASILLPILPVSAQVGFKNGIDQVQNKAQGDAKIRNFSSFQELVGIILRVLLTLVVIIAVAAIVYGGFLYITSAGDEGKAATGKRIVLYAIIGLLIMAAAAIIVNVIINVFFGGQQPAGLGGANGCPDPSGRLCNQQGGGNPPPP